MLDWELAHIGDPMEDLGWVTNPYHPAMPRAPGPCRISLADCAVVVTLEQELQQHAAPTADATSARIAAHIERLIPDGATLQVGFGDRRRRSSSAYASPIGGTWRSGDGH